MHAFLDADRNGETIISDMDRGGVGVGGGTLSTELNQESWSIITIITADLAFGERT